jgi:hypothetical protein
MDVVSSLGYVGQQNAISFPYTQQWNPHYSNLTVMVQQLFLLVQQKPPVAPQQMPQQPQIAQSQAWGGQ